MTSLLYSFRRCPYAIRARMALWLNQCPVKIIEVSLKDKPKAMLELSPKGTVPVLYDKANDLILEESLDIMLYAIDNGQKPSMDKADAKHPLIDINDKQFKPLLDSYKYHIRYPESPEYYRDKATSEILMPLEEILNQHAFLNGKKYTLIDIALFPFIRQFAHIDLDWFANTCPKLHLWLDDWKKSPCFIAIMEKSKP